MSLSGWACGRKGILVEGGITFYQEACHSGSSALVGEVPYRRNHVITGGVLVGGAFPCGRGHVIEGGVSLWEEHFLVEEAVHDRRCVLVGMGASL